MRSSIKYAGALAAIAACACMAVGSAAARVAAAPTVTSFTPQSAAGGGRVTLTGANLAGAQVQFSGMDAASVTVNPAGTQIVATVSPETTKGKGQITVITPGGTWQSPPTAFEILAVGPTATTTTASGPSAAPSTANGPAGATATGSARVPDAKAVPMLPKAKVSLLQAIRASARYGPVIEAKFELDDAGRLSLSTYTASKGLSTKGNLNVFKEVSGVATSAPWRPSAETITDNGDLAHSRSDLAIMQKAKIGLATALQLALSKQHGVPYWAVPTTHGGKPVIGVYVRSSDGRSHHLFIPVSGVLQQ
jgi:hypothetical protein